MNRFYINAFHALYLLYNNTQSNPLNPKPSKALEGSSPLLKKSWTVC